MSPQGGRDPIYGRGSSESAQDILLDVLASLAREGVRSPRGVLHWASCIEAFTEFVDPNSKEPQATVLLVTMLVKDLHLRVRKDWIIPTVTL